MAGNGELEADFTIDVVAFANALRAALRSRECRSDDTGTWVIRLVLPASVPISWLLGLTDKSPVAENLYYWCHPNDGLYIAGFGMEAEISADGDQRFQQVEEQMEAFHFIGTPEDENYHLPPVWFGGYAFTPKHRGFPWLQWPDAYLVMPRWQFAGGKTSAVAFQALCPANHSVDEFVAAAVEELNQWLEWTGTGNQPATRDYSWPQDGHDTGKQWGQSAGSVEDTQEMRGCIAANFNQWRQAVDETARDIRNGRYRKAVLARCQVSPLPRAYSLERSLRYLVSTYPESMTFLFRRHGEVFLGASPEHLVDVADGRVHIDCLAGSIRRGTTPREDEALGQELLLSAKDLHEHQVVVESVMAAVADKISDVTVAGQPQLRKLANVQHLYTPIEGQLDHGTVLSLVRTLHPTPAVAGQPRDAALAVIAQREAMARGWYAGALGMVTKNGDGHFLVALRSALLAGHHAYLYAGAGIMGESEAESEWQETQWKLLPMQSALQQTGVVTGGSI